MYAYVSFPDTGIFPFFCGPADAQSRPYSLTRLFSYVHIECILQIKATASPSISMSILQNEAASPLLILHHLPELAPPVLLFVEVL